jgi:hypothetical protein
LNWKFSFPKTTTTTRDMQHAKNTSAWALMKDGHMAGRMVANWNRGTYITCTATVILYDNSGFGFRQATGTAGGYGYDKLSAAVYRALKEMQIEPVKLEPANGLTRAEFEALGFQVVEVL